MMQHDNRPWPDYLRKIRAVSSLQGDLVRPEVELQKGLARERKAAFLALLKRQLMPLKSSKREPGTPRRAAQEEDGAGGSRPANTLRAGAALHQGLS
jgi:hypothetical protein